MKQLIGLCALARCGKTTVANHLHDHHGLEHYSFASPLKRGLWMMLGLTHEHTEGDLKELPMEEFGGKSPRQMMQTLGTEWGRNLIAEDVWLTCAKKALANADHGLVIADVRYENEAQWIRDHGGVIVHIQRPGAEKVSSHASEAGVAIAAGDLVVLNDGSLNELYANVDLVVKKKSNQD